ncbi:MAG: DUF5103 domain-containing protein [Cyclobacteriaceae bacterium]
MIKPKFSFLLCFAFLLFSLSAVGQGKKQYNNEVFKPFVKTVRLYPQFNTVDQDLQTPIVSINSNPGLILEFDALLEDYEPFQAKILHCNADWTQSMLSDIEIMSEYNSFDLDDFEYSENTNTLYTHYIFKVPPTKVSGNFILMVYQNNDQSDVLFTRRFVVFEDRVAIKSNVALSTSVSSRNFNQQIEFSLNYGNLKVSNPHSDVYVVIRQNQRWDNAIYGLRPTIVRQDQSYIEYRHFNQENNFLAGNEFRFIDLRTYLFRGQNIAYINSDMTPMVAHIIVDENRSRDVYSQLRDINGQYFIETREPQAGYLESDYFKVKFQLRSPHKQNEDVFVLGAFNDWMKNDESKMIYDAGTGLYTCDILLKQGVYSYTYHLNGNPYFFEGSFYQTENDYDILVYYRPLGSFTERVIGYSSFTTQF